MVERAKTMATMTCPLGHTDDVNNFHRPTGNATMGGHIFINSILICPECRVLFRRKSISEQATEVRMAMARVNESAYDGT